MGSNMGSKAVVETIKISSISTISFSGKVKERVRKKKESSKKAALHCGGEILRDVECKDGFFLEVLFPNIDIKEAWEKSLK